MNSRFIASSAIALALSLAAPAAIANDSSAAVGLGGLELTRNDAISMESEDLFISRDLVTVKYRFTNTSAKDVETLVSFPLPPLPPDADAYVEEQTIPDWQADLQFKTLVDGKPASLEMKEVISLFGRPGAKNVEKRLKELGWPVHYWVDYKFTEKLQELPDDKKQAYMREGLLRTMDGSDYVQPNWQVATNVTRTQLFPAGKTVIVEHSYKPFAGGSVGGGLDRQWRTGKDSGFTDYAKRHCIDKSFLAAFDKKSAAVQKRWKAKGENGGPGYSEIWLDYVLKSGANWKGPIKDFRLVVDKDSADNLVSFCMHGVKKIGPTRFEVRRKNFEPTRDLNILIVQFVDPDHYY